MYRTFEIKNFRCFDELKLDNLARVNLIGGKNNVGKTALLEAFLLHSGNYDIELILRTRFRKDRKSLLRPTPLQAILDWNTLFSKFDISELINLKGEYKRERPKQMPLFPNDDFALNDWELKIKVVELRDLPPETPSLRRVLRDTNGLDLSTYLQALELKYSNSRSYYIIQHDGRIVSDRIPSPLVPAIFLSSLEGVPLSEDAKRFSELKRSRNQDVLLRALHVIEPRLEDLELFYDGDPPMIYGEVGLNQPMPLIAMGDGVNRITSLVLAIANAPDGVVLVDEIENGLHYKALKDVWKAIGRAAREFNTQIFATSHSWECITAAHQAFSEEGNYDFSYRRLDRTNDGNIKAVTYDQETLESAIEIGMEVR